MLGFGALGQFALGEGPIEGQPFGNVFLGKTFQRIRTTYYHQPYNPNIYPTTWFKVDGKIFPLDGTVAATVVFVLGKPAPVGSTIVGIVTFDNSGSSTISVTDDKGNVYNLETKLTDTGDVQSGQCFSLSNINNGPQTITVTFSPSAGARAGLVECWTGAAAVADARSVGGRGGQWQGSVGTGANAITSGNFTPADNGCLIWGATITTNGVTLRTTAGTAFTISSNENASIVTSENKILPVAASTAALFTQTATSQRINSVISFKPFVSAPIFNQKITDRGSFRKAASPFDPGYNLNLYGGVVVAPSPIVPIDSARAFRVRETAPDSSVSINPNLPPVEVAPPSTPDSVPAFRTRDFQPYPQDGINLNLFTNPFPFVNLTPADASPYRHGPNPDQPYNPNLYQVVITASPFIPIDFGPVRAVRHSAPLDAPFNPNLVPTAEALPFNQTDFSTAFRAKLAAPTPAPLNPNLFTNPVPFTSVNPLSIFARRAATDLGQAYNPNLYPPSALTPLNPTDTFLSRRSPSAPADRSFGLNPNLIPPSGPLPFFNAASTAVHRPLPLPPAPVIGFDPSRPPPVTNDLLIQRTLTGVGL